MLFIVLIFKNNQRLYGQLLDAGSGAGMTKGHRIEYKWMGRSLFDGLLVSIIFQPGMVNE